MRASMKGHRFITGHQGASKGPPTCETTTGVIRWPAGLRPRNARSSTKEGESEPYAHVMDWADYVTEKSAAVNQADLADRLGVSQSTISRWRSGKNAPTVENVIDFARAVGDSPVAALVMFGFLRESEVGEVVHLKATADQLNAYDLLAELGRRLGIQVTQRGVRAG